MNISCLYIVTDRSLLYSPNESRIFAESDHPEITGPIIVRPFHIVARDTRELLVSMH